MIIVKAILFIMAVILLLKAVLKEDFNYLFLSILLLAIGLGLTKVM
jgi:hypothetical protein